jgi:hypothetical protein
MGYTLGEASKQTGKSKSTLSKAVKNGKLSATKLEDGSFSIEPVELFRVFPPQQALNVDIEQSRTPDGTHENSYKIKILELELQHTREKLEEARGRIEEAKERIEEARERISKLDDDKEHLKRLLNGPTTPPSTPKNWIQRLFRA